MENGFSRGRGLRGVTWGPQPHKPPSSGTECCFPLWGRPKPHVARPLSPARWQEVHGESATGPRNSGSHLVARRRSPSLSSLLALAGGPEGSEAQRRSCSKAASKCFVAAHVGSLSKLPGAHTRARTYSRLERAQNTVFEEAAVARFTEGHPQVGMALNLLLREPPRLTNPFESGRA